MSALHLQIRRGTDRFISRGEGLISRHSFSFGEHYDPEHVGCGALMVNNHDVVESGAGYGDHPHADAEILTWVLSGTLQHVDSAGHRGLVWPGLAQRMSAGSGIIHAERNDAYRDDPALPIEPVEFVQMWVRPDVSGGAPAYAHREVSFAELARSWVPVVSGSHRDADVRIDSAGSTMWVSVLRSGVTRPLPEAPYVHVFVARGEVDLEGAGRLSAGDALQIEGGAALAATGVVEAELLVWTMIT